MIPDESFTALALPLKLGASLACIRSQSRQGLSTCFILGLGARRLITACRCYR